MAKKAAGKKVMWNVYKTSGAGRRLVGVVYAPDEVSALEEACKDVREAERFRISVERYRAGRRV